VTPPPERQKSSRSSRSRRLARRSWQDRLEDRTEPLYTIGVVAELLDLDTQSVRRLEYALEQASARPSGNQRRYSRADIEAMAAAAELAAEGLAPEAVARILDLQQRLEAAGASDP
jgi:MerR family transcriptional regulator, heat shock protein HspR